MGGYRVLIICMDFKASNLCDTHMLYFIVVAKLFVMTLRVRTSNSALVFLLAIFLSFFFLVPFFVSNQHQLSHHCHAPQYSQKKFWGEHRVRIHVDAQTTLHCTIPFLSSMSLSLTHFSSYSVSSLMIY